MIALPRKESLLGEFSDMTTAELESEWRATKVCFDQALAQKIETDRIYVAAATRLNTLDRLMKKVVQRTAATRREDARVLFRTATAADRT